MTITWSAGRNIWLTIVPPRVQNVNHSRRALRDRAWQPVASEVVTEDATHLTRATFERLQAELEDLTTRGRVEIARAIEAARALGDLSENGDYHAAKDTQGKMEARIRQLQATLSKAQLVEEGSGEAAGTVAAGSVVAIRYEGDDDIERFLVGSIEERHDELSVVSPGSPLGQALLGKAAGESVQYEAPGGTLRVEIVEVSAQGGR
jgi:transcription elongation factor GreA